MDELPGYDQPQSTADQYVLNLYRQHGLGDNPTMRQIEPVATQLLEHIGTILDGAALVLGRYVGSQEKDVNHIVFMPISAQDRFTRLLIMKGISRQ